MVLLLADTAFFSRGKVVFGGDITGRYSLRSQTIQEKRLYFMILLQTDTAKPVVPHQLEFIWSYYYLKIQQRGCQSYRDDRLYLAVILQADTVSIPGIYNNIGCI